MQNTIELKTMHPSIRQKFSANICQQQSLQIQLPKFAV